VPNWHIIVLGSTVLDTYIHTCMLT